MSAFVLIVVLTANGGVAMNSIPMATLQACQDALAKFEVFEIGVRNASGICVRTDA